MKGVWVLWMLRQALGPLSFREVCSLVDAYKLVSVIYS